MVYLIFNTQTIFTIAEEVTDEEIAHISYMLDEAQHHNRLVSIKDIEDFLTLRKHTIQKREHAQDSLFCFYRGSLNQLMEAFEQFIKYSF